MRPKSGVEVDRAAGELGKKFIINPGRVTVPFLSLLKTLQALQMSAEPHHGTGGALTKRRNLWISLAEFLKRIQGLPVGVLSHFSSLRSAQQVTEKEQKIAAHQ